MRKEPVGWVRRFFCLRLKVNLHPLYDRAVFNIERLMMVSTDSGPYFDENASSAVKPVQLTPQWAKGRSAPCVSCCLHPLVCQFNFKPGPNSTGRRMRHLDPSFCPEIQFPPFLRAPGPIPVSRP